ncbi:MAG: hypothetical protein H0T62_06835 [Parachlamydiaceae bacterium]|nr:hypothetical protein [Parachlamydiaceae bacterium]
MIVPGRASVVVVRDSSEILADINLDTADRESFEKSLHKVVIVHTPESANTYPVINFSDMGIPCLYYPDKERLEQQTMKLKRITP